MGIRTNKPAASGEADQDNRYRVVAVELEAPVPNVNVEAVMAVAMIHGEPIGRTRIWLGAGESQDGLLGGATLEARARVALWQEIWAKELGGFTPELGAGAPTASGGEIYLLAPTIVEQLGAPVLAIRAT